MEFKKKKTDKKESKLLKLNSLKSKKLLNWEPILKFGEAVKFTAIWYKSFYKNEKNCFELSSSQLFIYEKKMKKHFKNKKINI